VFETNAYGSGQPEAICSTPASGASADASSGQNSRSAIVSAVDFAWMVEMESVADHGFIPSLHW
jgi:hypothetical protein